MTDQTKSSQVVCPDCGVPYVVQLPVDRQSARFDCAHCDERISVPVSGFEHDQRDQR